jgi:hypothetical protein
LPDVKSKLDETPYSAVFILCILLAPVDAHCYVHILVVGVLLSDARVQASAATVLPTKCPPVENLDFDFDF